MSVEQMRKSIEQVYPGGRWKDKVSKMKDGQVIAIYTKFLEKKLLKK